MSVKAGDRWRNLQGDICHVIAVSDSGTKDGAVATYRWWKSSQQLWHYNADLVWVIEQFWAKA